MVKYTESAESFGSLNDHFITTIDKVHVQKKQTINSVFLTILIKKMKKKTKHLRAVNYCSWLTHVHSCIPLPPLCFRLNTSYWFQRREVRWSPHTHLQKLRFRMIKEGRICYKVMMKSRPPPTRGSLECQCFQPPWTGCALRILHLLRLLIVFTFPKATSGSLSLW